MSASFPTDAAAQVAQLWPELWLAAGIPAVLVADMLLPTARMPARWLPITARMPWSAAVPMPFRIWPG